MTLSNAQFNALNIIALTLVRKIDTKTYDEMCEILNDIYKTDIAESEECAKEIPVDTLSWCGSYSGCSIRGYHRHTKAF